MTSLLERTWHAPPGYRVVTTDERVYVEQAWYLSRRRAERRAAERNHHRTVPSHEWRVEQVGRRFRLVAYQNRIEPIGGDE